MQALSDTASIDVLTPEIEAKASEALATALREHAATQAYLSGKPRLFRWCTTLVRHQLFDFVIIAVIVANIVALAYDHHGISTRAEDQLAQANIVFSTVFLAEMVLKLTGAGPGMCVLLMQQQCSCACVSTNALALRVFAVATCVGGFFARQDLGPGRTSALARTCSTHSSSFSASSRSDHRNRYGL